MSFFGWGKSGRDANTDHTGRNLQDGLFQIASQACHILVQVNNTHNVSYGGSNRVTNVAYSKYSGGEGSTSLSSPATSPPSAPASGVYTKNVGTDPLLKDQDVVVLLPQRKSRTPRIRHKLARTIAVCIISKVEQSGFDDDEDTWKSSVRQRIIRAPINAVAAQKNPFEFVNAAIRVIDGKVASRLYLFSLYSYT
ncbi:hypothetical protein TSAR_006065 [Trichomalopsis sarcophagae]|uniref:Uncharacterized protein n=1 Tax=Trichomalopsis sarcophagae TaxID=543379 RepID=A0A232F1N3_9HYME|nr:hypothetical protein TSAR_006065 [Trichomalopsis sarcophagae]